MQVCSHTVRHEQPSPMPSQLCPVLMLCLNWEDEELGYSDVILQQAWATLRTIFSSNLHMFTSWF